jgi:hypothetical protein
MILKYTGISKKTPRLNSMTLFSLIHNPAELEAGSLSTINNAAVNWPALN